MEQVDTAYRGLLVCHEKAKKQKYFCVGVVRFINHPLDVFPKIVMTRIDEWKGTFHYFDNKNESTYSSNDTTHVQ